jgi:hypothetical protein
MAKFLGVPAMQFEVMYPEKAKEMKRMVLEYMKVLRRAHIDNSQNTSNETTNGFQNDTLQMDDSGFPVAPRPISWTKVKKGDIEHIYRLYIARHYRRSFHRSAGVSFEIVVLELACRDDNRQAPFEKIIINPSNFIDPDCLPAGLAIRDPRSMRLESLMLFFKHISERETSHGIPHAFRFKAVLSSRKLGKMRPANYRYDGDGQDDVDETPPVRRKRRKRQSESGITPVLRPDVLEEPIQPPATVTQSMATTGQSTPTSGNTPATPQADQQAGRATLTSRHTSATRTTRQGTSAISPTGLHTPADTPTRNEVDTQSPQPYSRRRKSIPVGPPAKRSTLSIPRRSQRTAEQSTPANPPNAAPKKKPKKARKTKSRG